MQRLIASLLVLAALAVSGSSLAAAEARIVKVLPHYLDLQGRHALSPSLYERDAYQARLRKRPAERSGLRFDIQWKLARPRPEGVTLRLELRGVRGTVLQQLTLEQPAVKKSRFGCWTSIPFEGEAFRNFGELTAWRATLCHGTNQLASRQSFLW